MPRDFDDFRPVFESSDCDWPDVAGQAVDWRPTAWPVDRV